MKRFLYDAILLIILLMIGISISDDKAETTQERMERFDQEIKQQKNVEFIEESVSLNAVEDNYASYIAKTFSLVIRDVTDVGVGAVKSIFDVLVKES